jgi:hypothetical protein
MSDVTRLCIYLQPPLFALAQANRSRVIQRITMAMAWRGVECELRPNTPAARNIAELEGERRIYQQGGAVIPGALLLRPCHSEPFWQIEASVDPWSWSATQARFEPGTVDPDAARQFLMYRRRRLFGRRDRRLEGFVAVPISGRLARRRDHQAMSTLDMMDALRGMEPDRDILLTVEPDDSPSPADQEALRQVLRRHKGVRLVSRSATDLLARCDYVVTQDSALTLDGFFMEKPSVLFAKAEFHHIAGSVPRDGIGRAFDIARSAPPDYARYLHWYLRGQMIDVGADDAEQAILARLRVLRWDI